MKVVLEDGTKVVSDNLKIGLEQAKRFSEQYDVKINKNDTYAEAIDKYSKKIGLDAKNEEIENIYKKLEKK